MYIKDIFLKEILHNLQTNVLKLQENVMYVMYRT